MAVSSASRGRPGKAHGRGGLLDARTTPPSLRTAPDAPAAVVLAIDQAATSGWALRASRELLASGVATTAIERRDIVARAVAEATSRGWRLAVVLEKWTVGGGRRGGKTRWNPITMIGLGDARGRWREHLDLAGLPRSRLVEVTPAEWRAVFWGRVRLSRDAFKARAVPMAQSRGFSASSHDEAEALLISEWAIYASAEVTAIAATRARGA